jgi:hypothetical protein
MNSHPRPPVPPLFLSSSLPLFLSSSLPLFLSSLAACSQPQGARQETPNKPRQRGQASRGGRAQGNPCQVPGRRKGVGPRDDCAALEIRRTDLCPSAACRHHAVFVAPSNARTQHRPPQHARRVLSKRDRADGALGVGAGVYCDRA